MAKLSINEAAISGYTDIVQLDYLDLVNVIAGTNPWSGAALAVAGELPIGVIPAGGSMALVSVIETVAFAGTTSVVVNIGVTTTDPDEFIDALDVDAMTTGQAVSNTGDVMVKSAATTTFAGGYLPVSSSAAAQTVIFKIGDAAMGSATAGKLLIGMKINDLYQFSDAINI
mgnify:CR=1 FL=1|tara:strand:+ start:64 stop:576 length:513 start_codon:yes stop_codon:yes gene_type:complete